MLLSAVVAMHLIAAVFLVLDRSYQFTGLGAVGGFIVAFAGLRIADSGIQRQTNTVSQVDLGGIPLGFVLAMAGAMVAIISMDKYRRAF